MSVVFLLLRVVSNALMLEVSPIGADVRTRATARAHPTPPHRTPPPLPLPYHESTSYARVWEGHGEPRLGDDEGSPRPGLKFAPMEVSPTALFLRENPYPAIGFTSSLPIR